MTRLSISTWHEGNPRCDEYFQMPAELTKDEAIGLALLKLQCDKNAVQVEIEFDEENDPADVIHLQAAHHLRHSA